ncbi:hypothetical protein F4776DRAFT_600291 [Hypoxylon sp. NC0597]|nr:hypothetical protein F4776DRAFT_600291 [Hypoxylon sp. NC0597]
MGMVHVYRYTETTMIPTTRDENQSGASSLTTTSRTIIPNSIIKLSKRIFFAGHDRLRHHVTRDDDDSESKGINLTEEITLGIICGGILAIFLILGLLWLFAHIRRKRLARRSQSPSLQLLKDPDTRDRSRESMELIAAV